MDLFPVITITLGTKTIPAHPVVLLLGVFIASALFMGGAGRHGLSVRQSMRLLVLGIVSSLFFSRLVYSAVRYDHLFFDAMDGNFLGLSPFLDPMRGGLSVLGALFGAWIAALIDARIARGATAPRLDAFAVPLAILVGIARFAEILAGQGYGNAVELAWLRFFPLAIQDGYSDWFIAVFALAGLLALAIAASLAHLERKRRIMPGGLFLRLMIPLCAGQIFLESLRRDDYLRLENNGFVRVSQLMALMFLVIITAYLTWRIIKSGLAWRHSIAGWMALITSAGAAIAAEFYEKLPLPLTLLYTVSAIAQVVLAIVLLRLTIVAASGVREIPGSI